MTREEAKELLPIMQAFAEGKTIQSKQINAPDKEWRDIEECNFLRQHSYRIKPEQKYRPFKTQEECWHEMHKHPDFGWVLRSGVYLHILSLYKDALYIQEEHDEIYLHDAFDELTFTDGTPFGIKEEDV